MWRHQLNAISDMPTVKCLHRNSGAPHAPESGVRKMGRPQLDTLIEVGVALLRALTTVRAATMAATSSEEGLPLMWKPIADVEVSISEWNIPVLACWTRFTLIAQGSKRTNYMSTRVMWWDNRIDVSALGCDIWISEGIFVLRH